MLLGKLVGHLDTVQFRVKSYSIHHLGSNSPKKSENQSIYLLSWKWETFLSREVIKEMKKAMMHQSGHLKINKNTFLLKTSNRLRKS